MAVARLVLVRVSFGAHFQTVEPGPFHFCGDPIADQALDDHEKTAGERKNHDCVDGHANRLRDELASIAEQKSADRTGDSVPSLAIIAVGEYSERKRTPQPASAVDGDRTDRIVNPEVALQEDHEKDHQEARDRAYQHRRDWRDESARCGDRDEAAQHSIARYCDVGFAVAFP